MQYPLSSTTALVLTGGGARGAYQAGVISQCLQILKDNGIENPFGILAGSSAGAINNTFYASILGQQKNPIEELPRFWMSLKNDHVYKNDLISLTNNSFKWMSHLALGSVFGEGRGLSLLDNSPLRSFLKDNLDFSAIAQALESQIKCLSLSAINYETGFGRTFYQSAKALPPWKRAKRDGQQTQLTLDHVMASSAIPMLFPPVYVEGCYYGDGSLRDYTPFSPPINLGADRIFAVGVRSKMREENSQCSRPSPGRILSVILNGILLDAMDLDYERLQRINKTLELIPGKRANKLKVVDVLMITPSRLIGEIAKEEANEVDKIIRFLIKGLGNIDDAADLISYILFETPYVRKLIDLGKEDAWINKEEILNFFTSDKK